MRILTNTHSHPGQDTTTFFSECTRTLELDYVFFRLFFIGRLLHSISKISVVLLTRSVSLLRGSLVK